MSLRLTFQIEMTSDYHVGAGYGKGTEVDSALLRDADGVPVLRGTMVNGLLRDALWRLLQKQPLRRWHRCEESGKEDAEERYCGQYGGDDSAACPICRVFGTPRRMKRWRIGSARPAHLKELSADYHEVEEFPSQEVARVRVDPRTRRAAPRKLFVEEQGGQLTFTFTATCLADPEKDMSAVDEAALLVAAARFTRQLGRSRRRGQGECLLRLIDVEGIDLGADGDERQQELLDRFESHWLRGEPSADEYRGAALSRRRGGIPEGGPMRLRVVARLDEPLIIARRASAGNQFRTQDAIPGKTVRGALAARAAERFDLTDEVTYDAFVDVFLRGGIGFPTLYPLFRQKTSMGSCFYAAAPVPRDGFACKVYDDHPVHWGTQAEGRVEMCGKCGNPVKGVRGAFLSLQKEPERFEPKKRSEMHIRVDPESGRVEEGQLFEYDALEAGQYFAGELTCADPDAWELLQTLADVGQDESVSLRLGKATRRGYGAVTMWLERQDPDEASMWVKLPIEARVNDEDEELTLTLMTDAIVTDAWGRFVTGFDEPCRCGEDASSCRCRCEWLSEALGFDVQVAKGRGFATTRVIDGFNTQLRLPRWREIALAAGSTVRLRVLKRPEGGLLNALARKEREGVGRRRNEGYGKVAFNYPTYKRCDQLTDTQVTIPSEMQQALISDTDEAMRARFQREWEEQLAEQKRWNQCTAPCFLGLARWLDSHRHDAIEELLAQMSELGEPDGLLVDALGGEGERGRREIANPLTKKEGFKMVKTLLRELQAEESVHQPLGVRMLADRLAEAAGDKEGGQ